MRKNSTVVGWLGRKAPTASFAMTDLLAAQLQDLESERARLEKELDACLDKLNALHSQISRDKKDARHAPIKAEFLQAQSAQDLDRLMEVVAKALSAEVCPAEFDRFVHQYSFVRQVQGNGRVYRTIVNSHGAIMCCAQSNGDVHRDVPWSHCDNAAFNVFHADYAVIRKTAYKLTWS